MSKPFSFAAFVAYGNSCINNTTKKTPEIQTAFKTDLKKAIAHAGYPSKDEIGIIDEINDFDMSNTLEKIPEIVGGFMKDEDRAFKIPAPDKKTAPATLEYVHKDKATKTGIIQMGDRKGEEYKSTTAAHDELKLKNNTSSFKESK